MLLVELEAEQNRLVAIKDYLEEQLLKINMKLVITRNSMSAIRETERWKED